ncbi:hypothetical protein GCM10027046_01300 [Uliginosibacterium flavum]|uniref:DUF2799 domain-containing protein n=1 Tax=Uliginosibacterium flavum TaxID=1396831 RepID=A0ABV2TIG2_9RHOO
MPLQILRRFALYATLLASLFVLNGCATLSEQDCRSGDWAAVGYRDGQNGRPQSRLDEHRKACSEYGIKPNPRVYEEARERGLNFYCTPANGLSVGRRGEHYAGVCPDWSEGGFLQSYEVGRDVFEARQRLERLESEQRDIEMRLRKADKKDDVRYLAGQMSRLRMERDFAWDELRRREYRADRLRF